MTVIEQLLALDYPHTTWLFIGDSLMIPDSMYIKGMRNYVGHFEEYIRFAIGATSENARQRFVINNGIDYQSIENLVSYFEEKIERFDPQIVVYKMDENLSESSPERIANFEKQLHALIEKSLRLRNQTGIIVIQGIIEVNDIKNCYNEIAQKICFNYKLDRVIYVKHERFIENKYFASKKQLNEFGHLLLAKQLVGSLLPNANLTFFDHLSLDLKLSSKPNLDRLNIVLVQHKEIADFIRSKQSINWLFIGDSITHAALWTFGYDGMTQIFEKYLNRNFTNQKHRIMNTAVSGATSGMTVNALEYRVLKYDCDIAVIMLGTNDASALTIETPAIFRENIRTILDHLQNSAKWVILRTPTPVAPDEERAEKLLEYIEILEQLAEIYSNIIVIDQFRQWNQMMQENVEFWKHDYKIFADAIHPGVNGHLMMAELLIKQLGIWQPNDELGDLWYSN